MAVYDLEEQEQISQIKAWWNENGKLVFALLILLSVAVVGINTWRWHAGKQSAEASQIYLAVQDAAGRDNPQDARDAAGRLIAEYGSTIYAQMGALLSAAVQFRHQDLENAQAQLEWAADKGKDPGLGELARLRLATVLLQKGAPDDALARLAPLPTGANLPRYHDLRGDILASQGKNEEARAAYQAALDALLLTSTNSREEKTLEQIIRVKMESLGA